jgi:hypothetical protein
MVSTAEAARSRAAISAAAGSAGPAARTAAAISVHGLFGRGR